MKCSYSQTIEIEENKELEALEIAKTLCELTPTKEEKDLIVSALTRLEKLEKAIEICKNKCVDVINILRNDILYQYNKSVKEKYFFYEDYLLTEEEFKLLKEVFGK